MSEYKPIREWIARGINPGGFVDKLGAKVVSVNIAEASCDAIMQLSSGDYEPGFPLTHLVAPPISKRMKNETLVLLFMGAVAATERARDQNEMREHAKFVDEYQDKILRRMRGPTRDEVEKALGFVLSDRKGSVQFKNAYVDFLSMFPEGADE